MRKRTLIIILIPLFACGPVWAKEHIRKERQNLHNLVCRILPPEEKNLFRFSIRPLDTPYFEIRPSGKKIVIRGDSPVSIASGLRYYQRRQISQPFSQIQRVRKEHPNQAIFYFTNQNFSAVTADWDWIRWEKEIDRMAMLGVNHPLSVTMLQALPTELAQKIEQRMEEYRMTPSSASLITKTPVQFFLRHEYTESNPLLFDWQSDHIWSPEESNIDGWLEAYPLHRYGYATPALQRAWKGFSQTIYPINAQYADHDHPLLTGACEAFIEEAQEVQHHPLYQSDLTVAVTHYLSNLRQQAYINQTNAEQCNDLQLYNRELRRYMELTADADTLLALRSRGNPVATAVYLFKKYRAKELEPPTSIVELPISFKDGYGPFTPQFHSLHAHPAQVFGLTQGWTEVKSGIIPIDQNTHILFATGKDLLGRLQMIIDTNHNFDLRDENAFIPQGQIISINIWDTIPLCVSTIPGQPIPMAHIARYATARLGSLELSVCSNGFADFNFEQTHLAIDKGIQAVPEEIITLNEYILHQDTLYRYQGIDLHRNILILEKTTASQRQIYAAQVGFRAIPFSGTDYISRRSVALEDYRGKYLLLDFWGSWCGVRLQELPYFYELYHQLDHTKVECVGILDSSPASSLDHLIQIHQISWPQIYSESSHEIAQAYSISSFPMALLIDPDGIIIAKTSSVKDMERLLWEHSLIKP